jgi:hypothetical protein
MELNWNVVYAMNFFKKIFMHVKILTYLETKVLRFF